LSQRR